MIAYKAPGGYFAQHFPRPSKPGSTVVLFKKGEEGFIVIAPPEWRVPQEPDEEGNPRPPIPLDPWAYYQQEYPEIMGSSPQPMAEEVDSWEPEPEEPEPPPAVTDVEIMTPVFIDYRRQATLHMDGLKAQVWSYLKNEQEMDPALATAAGVAFCKSSTGIGVQYDDYIKAGGHPDAAADLWARIQEIKGNFAWFDAGVEAIFAAALGQEV